jgi:hypothetical protein
MQLWCRKRSFLGLTSWPEEDEEEDLYLHVQKGLFSLLKNLFLTSALNPTCYFEIFQENFSHPAAFSISMCSPESFRFDIADFTPPRSIQSYTHSEQWCRFILPESNLFHLPFWLKVDSVKHMNDWLLIHLTELIQLQKLHNIKYDGSIMNDW